MSFKYTLKIHSDNWYRNFFDTFSDEYVVAWGSQDPDALCDLIDKHLSKYNAVIDRTSSTGELIFESEAHFHWFVLRWS